jgi:hypothetical protein
MCFLGLLDEREELRYHVMRNESTATHGRNQICASALRMAMVSV